MDAFLASLSEEVLGLFLAIQHDLDCDEKLEEILNVQQCRLYLKTKTTPETMKTEKSDNDFHFDNQLLQKLKKENNFIWLDIWRKSQIDGEMKEFDDWREKTIEEAKFVETLTLEKQTLYEQWKENTVPTVSPFFDSIELPEKKKKLFLSFVTSSNFEALDSCMECYPEFEEMYQWWKAAIMKQEQCIQENKDTSNSIDSVAKDYMKEFEACLSDEQLGIFFAMQYDQDCDQKMSKILSSEQYELYLKTKDEISLLLKYQRLSNEETVTKDPNCDEGIKDMLTGMHYTQKIQGDSKIQCNAIDSTREESGRNNAAEQKSASNSQLNGIQRDCTTQILIEIEGSNSDREMIAEQLNRDSVKDHIQNNYSTSLDVVKGEHFVSVTFITSSSGNIDKAIDYVWIRLHPLQRYTTSKLSSICTCWNLLTFKEQLDFQTKYQVTIKCDNGDRSTLVMRSFVPHKLAIATADLRNNQTRFSRCRNPQLFLSPRIMQPQGVHVNLTIEYERGEEQIIIGVIRGEADNNLTNWKRFYNTTVSVTTGMEMIRVEMTSQNRSNIRKTEDDFWRELRPFMKYRRIYNLSPNSTWEAHSTDDKTKFQRKWQVKIRKSTENSSQVMVHAFLQSKLNSAVASLNELNNKPNA